MLNLYFKFGKVFRRLMLLTYLFSGYVAWAVEIPKKINFVGIELIFDEAMLKQISREAYKIEQAPEKLQAAYENFKVYEKLLKQQLTKQGLPEDFIYLALSLSQMNPSFEDESTAGFWALPLPTQEALSNYKVNDLVDERFHPHIATAQVATTIKKYHTITNWLYAMLAYKIGLEAAQNQAKLMTAQLPKSEQGLVDQRLHIYGNYADPFLVKLFALKILIDERASKDQQISKGTLMQSDVQAISVRKLSKHLGVNEAEIRAFNPWIKSNQIPGDKTYSVFHLKIQEEPVIVTNELAPKPEDEDIDNAKLPVQNKVAGDSQNQLSVKKQTIIIDSVIYNPSTHNEQASSSGTAFSNLQKTSLDKTDNCLSPLIHIVQQGESLYSIAKSYKVSVDNLQLWNHLEDYMLLSDDRIMVSTPPDISNFQQSQQPFRWLTHTVGKGESLTKIAKSYQTSVAMLSQINQLTDPNQIVFGQRLIVPVTLRYTASPLFKKDKQR